MSPPPQPPQSAATSAALQPEGGARQALAEGLAALESGRFAPASTGRGAARWMKFGAFFLCAGVIVSLAVSKERMADSLHLIRAEKMVQDERWEDAYRSYRTLAPKHPGNTDVMLSYAEAAMHTGHHEDASRALLVLNGRPATRQQMWRAGQVSEELERAGYKHSAGPVPMQVSMN